MKKLKKLHEKVCRESDASYKGWSIDLEPSIYGDRIWAWEANNGNQHIGDSEGGELGSKTQALKQIKAWIDMFERGRSAQLKQMGLKVRESLSPINKLHEKVCRERNEREIPPSEGGRRIGVKAKGKKYIVYAKKIHDAGIIAANKYRFDVTEIEDVWYEKSKESLSEELKVNASYIEKLKENNINFQKVGDKLLVDESDSKRLDGLGIPYSEGLKKLYEKVCRK